jgi:hypothetical protein
MTLKKITAKTTIPKVTEKNSELVEIYLGNDSVNIYSKEIEKGICNPLLQEKLENAETIEIDNFTFLESIEDSNLSCGIFNCIGFASTFNYKKLTPQEINILKLGFIILDQFIVPLQNKGVTYQMCFNQEQYDVFKPYIAKFKNFQLVKTFKNPNSRNMNYLFISKI